MTKKYLTLVTNERKSKAFAAAKACTGGAFDFPCTKTDLGYCSGYYAADSCQHNGAQQLDDYSTCYNVAYAVDGQIPGCENYD